MFNVYTYNSSRRRKKINSIAFEDYGDCHHPNASLEIVSREDFNISIWCGLRISLGSIWASQVVKKSTCQCRKHKRCRFNPWVGKIPWSRKWQPAPVFLPEKFQGQRSLVGYSPWVAKSQTQLSEHTHTHTHSRFNIRSNSGPCIRVHIEEIHLGHHLTQSQKTWVLSVLSISQFHAQHYGETWAQSLN